MKNCLTCDFYERVPPGNCPDCGTSPGGLHGELCQKGPNVLYLTKKVGNCHRYPAVLGFVPSDYWCGEHIKLGTFGAEPLPASAPCVPGMQLNLDPQRLTAAEHEALKIVLGSQAFA